MYKATIILLFIYSGLSAQFISEFETGYFKYNNQVINEYSNKYSLNSFYSKFYIGYKYNKFQIKTETSIFFYKKPDTKTFSPIQSEFIIHFTYTHKNITFGYSHLCSHPVVNNHSDYNDSNKFFESYDKIYIRIKLVNNNL